jgi:hypothetical protein
MTLSIDITAKLVLNLGILDGVGGVISEAKLKAINRISELANPKMVRFYQK